MEMKKGELKNLLDRINLSVSKLYHIATHDQKTGLYNHIFFKDVFELELDKAKRGKKLSLVIADIDFFKKVNDTYGHLTADKILERIARVFEKIVRKYDIVARFGGEEFFVMLPATPIEKGKVIAQRLRRAVLNDPYLKKYKISASLGVSEYKKLDNFEKISKRADKGLYKAKKEGRNRVCVV